MKKVVWIAALVAALGLCPAVAAAPSLEGPTGIVGVPSTAVPDPGIGELSLSWQDISGDESRTLVRAVYGVAPKWEVGGLWWKDKNSGDIKTWGINAKYQVMREPEQQFGLALGLGYNKWDVNIPGAVPPAFDFKWTQYYAVLSKRLSTAAEGRESALGQVTGLAGLVGERGEVSVPGVGSDSESDTSLMLGLETVLHDGTYVGLEWRQAWEDVGDDIFSIVARRKINPELSAELGWTNSAGPWGMEDHRIFAGISYTWGAPKKQGTY
jgi:hypothetical protein